MALSRYTRKYFLESLITGYESFELECIEESSIFLNVTPFCFEFFFEMCRSSEGDVIISGMGLLRMLALFDPEAAWLRVSAEVSLFRLELTFFLGLVVSLLDFKVLS